MFNIQFLGATETVTGSNFLVTAGDTKFLVDMGMYQGPDVEERNLEDLEFDPSEIDFMLLTHSHLDHVGLIPKLTRHGFTGKIYATMHSAQIGEIIMRDSAKIQENNYAEGRPWKFSGRVELVYDKGDAERAIELFETINAGEEFSPAAGLMIKPIVAGHILGAVSYEIEYEGKVVVFSGDIGRTKQDLIEGFPHDHKREVDYVVMEALYGGQVHPDRRESVEEMIKIMREVTDNGGSVYVPCFSVQRTQEILNDIKLAKQSGALTNQLPVWLDSPMAQRVTAVYAAALDHGQDSAMNFPGLNYIRKHKKSLEVSRKKGQIIIAGSGMAEGGRIMNHIINNIGNKHDAFIFVGYQAEETLGRTITSGVKEIKVDETPVTVQAQIHHLQGFSAHGDSNDYMNWLKRYNSDRLKHTFLIHAETDRSEAFKQQLDEHNIDHPYIPHRGEIVNL